ncbi:MAG: hypothetical protein LBL00_00045 [Endomicrobium sp.]|jgi:hypothetical protein|nr:hypothetical protein [Endomicrobium sp.]
MADEKQKTSKSKGLIIAVILILLVIGASYFSTGFVTIQPIGALPEGITIWYFRAGLDLPFITSPDGYSLKKTGQLSLMSRAMAISNLTDAIEYKIILRLPYSKFLYNISTDGKEFEE